MGDPRRTCCYVCSRKVTHRRLPRPSRLGLRGFNARQSIPRIRVLQAHRPLCPTVWSAPGAFADKGQTTLSVRFGPTGEIHPHYFEPLGGKVLNQNG